MTLAAFDAVWTIVSLVGSYVLAVAPFVILASLMFSAMLYVFSAGNQKLTQTARDLFVRTLIATAIIAGYFMIKFLILELSTLAF